MVTRPQFPLCYGYQITIGSSRPLTGARDRPQGNPSARACDFLPFEAGVIHWLILVGPSSFLISPSSSSVFLLLFFSSLRSSGAAASLLYYFF